MRALPFSTPPETGALAVSDFGATVFGVGSDAGDDFGGVEITACEELEELDFADVVAGVGFA